MSAFWAVSALVYLYKCKTQIRDPQLCRNPDSGLRGEQILWSLCSCASRRPQISTSRSLTVIINQSFLRSRLTWGRVI